MTILSAATRSVLDELKHTLPFDLTTIRDERGDEDRRTIAVRAIETFNLLVADLDELSEYPDDQSTKIPGRGK